MQAKAYRGIGMEGRIARSYLTTVQKHIDEYTTLARRIAAILPPEARVLEVAPGPGLLSIELAKLGDYKITGLDISQTFVEMARENAAREGVAIDFRHGDAAHMPFDEGSFDLIVCRAAFKNFTDPVGALSEMRRVLRDGGRAIVIDMRRDVSANEINDYVSQRHKGVDALINRFIFKFVLVRRAYTEDQFRQFISASGFRNFTIEKQPLGFEISLVKDPG